jgi:hypothetical protein
MRHLRPFQLNREGLFMADNRNLVAANIRNRQTAHHDPLPTSRQIRLTAGMYCKGTLLTPTIVETSGQYRLLPFAPIS